MSKVKLIWSTPQGEDLVAYMARVSNPETQGNVETAGKLIQYLMKNKHWSPLDMVDVCVEIETTRDIARQILRHRSFYFQEFSQRYAEAYEWEICETRLQDSKNRQSSLDNHNESLAEWWNSAQATLLDQATRVYKVALNAGIAKEVARKVLPEGLTMSKMYMKGTLRNWLHYIDVRTDMATQKEHRIIAEQCKEIVFKEYPAISEMYQKE